MLSAMDGMREYDPESVLELATIRKIIDGPKPHQLLETILK